ncbi:xylulokinase [Streptomyces sp. NBC_00582]|uniref:xylulokinase n=1 Tax=Streptomyces sp. NBC_00582 TaxID=2975783 RepID=UPI001062B464|nr:FGGY-family carbohydrate kinase [Streptomyces sp. NBC_00582]WUB59655.1 FGGY-family carbohydrate kinase [Streptomyces sp. NBC_00582]
MTSGAVVCAVDIGTSAVRAALVTRGGRRLVEARSGRGPDEGAETFDAELLWEGLCDVLRRLSAEGPRADVRCLAIAGHVGQVPVDERGRPLGRAGGWADSRGVHELAHGWPDPADALRVTGRPAVTGGAVPLLCRLREEEPVLHERTRWVLAPKDFLVLRLTGAAATDPTSAAYTLGSDVTRRAWDPALLAVTGKGTRHFPPQHAATDIVGAVTPPAAEATGLPAGLPVAAGGPDGTVGAAAVAGGAVGAVVDVAGTTDVLTRVIASPDERPAAAVLNPYLTPDLWTCGGATGMTGGALAHWVRLLGLGDPATALRRLEPTLRALPPGSDGLSLSPLLTGSRFPGWNPNERGRLWGLGEHHTPAHVLHAAQEAASYVVRQAVDTLMADLAHDSAVVLTGGPSRSPALAQLRADVLGRPVLAATEADATLHGAALLALVAAGLEPDLPTAQAHTAPRLHRYTPRDAIAASYERLYREWLGAMGCMS